LIYLIYPTWALPVSVTGRFFIYAGLIIYFAISGFLTSRLLDNLIVNEPFITKPKNLSGDIKNHGWLLIICFIAVIFHSTRITIPILNLGDEALHIQGGLWVYDYVGRDWHRVLQFIFWVVAGLTFMGMIKNVREAYLRIFNAVYQKVYSRGSIKYYFFILLAISILYFLLLKDITYNLQLVRYAPVSRLLYLFSFLVAGITYIAPRIIQLTFYILTAIYLYRTINLFNDRRGALLALPVYLFSPIVFHYAHLAQLTSGVVFFIVLISFHFLRYLRDKDKRSLLLVSFFIGVGFLYKEDILLMFFICTFYLMFYRLKEENIIELKNEMKVLLISLIPVIPWMLIQRFVNWRQYTIHWDHFTSPVALVYPSLLWSHSRIIFILFIISTVFVLIKKRNNLTLYFGLLLIAFYLFYTADYTAPYKQHRFSVAFYPTMAVFLSQFLVNTIEQTKWRHSFKFVFLAIIIYLIFLSTNPYLSRYVFPDKTLKFPVGEAMKWVKANLKWEEKIVAIRIMPVRFYCAKYGIDRNRFIQFWYELGEILSPERLRNYCVKNNIKYIMFPYSPDYPKGKEGKVFEFLKSLKEDRNNDFTEMARFNIGEDYVYIYKMREKF
jgi:hypothetical protein